MAPRKTRNNNNNNGNQKKAVLYRPPIQNKVITISAGNSTVTGAAPFYTTMNAVAQGTSNVARVGSKCRMVEMDLIVQLVYGSSYDSALSRFLVVRDVAAEGVLTTNSEIFTSAGGPDSIRNMVTVNPDRFIVLFDYIFKRDDFTAPTQSGSTVAALFRKTLKLGFVTDYSRGNAGTIADIDTNAITCIGITNNTVANACSYSFASLIKFTDE